MNKYFTLLTKCVLGAIAGLAVYGIAKTGPIALAIFAAAAVILKAGKIFVEDK